MEEITDKELRDMIADFIHTDNWPDRTRLCLALIELRDLRSQRLPQAEESPGWFSWLFTKGQRRP
jgi:hypothetical protein